MRPVARRACEVLVVFAAGAAVGALFYPSRKVQEKEKVIAELSAERARIQARVTELEAHSKETIVIVEKPDGTKRARFVRIRDESAKEKRSEVSAEVEKETVQAERTESRETNQRRMGIGVGLRTDRSYFLQADGDVLGPLFFHVSADTKGVMGAGFGMRF